MYSLYALHSLNNWMVVFLFHSLMGCTVPGWVYEAGCLPAEQEGVDPQAELEQVERTSRNHFFHTEI